MKNVFVRAGALLMAAFVLFGAVIGVAPVQASAAEEYTVSGVWVFNDTLVFPSTTIQQDNLSFTTPNGSAGGCSEFVGICIHYKESFIYSLPAGSSTVYTSATGWVADASGDIKTVDFGSTEQAVSAEFYTWLTANATFQAPPPDPGPLVEAVTDLKEQDLLTQVLAGVVQMIPIGLACLVGYKGLRKALALLQGILHKA